MKVFALILTYNRLPLLKQCLKAVDRQTRKPDQVIVINNGSTDGTTEWLAQGHYTSFRFSHNQGCSAGFSYCIRKAYELGADWIWLMDDDTIPNADALEHLLIAIEKLNNYQHLLGFLASNVFWKDWQRHKMCGFAPIKDPKKKEAFPFLENTGLFPLQYCSFVSVLISAKAVQRVGLPIKEYFIWEDDMEYSKRILASGMVGVAVPDSKVIHATAVNNPCNLFKEPPINLWKFKYGLRNQLATIRLHQGELHFWNSWIRRMFIWPVYIALKRKDHKWAFMKALWIANIKAIAFHPCIEWVDGLSQNNLLP